MFAELQKRAVVQTLNASNANGERAVLWRRGRAQVQPWGRASWTTLPLSIPARGRPVGFGMTLQPAWGQTQTPKCLSSETKQTSSVCVCGGGGGG